MGCKLGGCCPEILNRFQAKGYLRAFCTGPCASPASVIRLWEPCSPGRVCGRPAAHAQVTDSGRPCFLQLTVSWNSFFLKQNKTFFTPAEHALRSQGFEQSRGGLSLFSGIGGPCGCQRLSLSPDFLCRGTPPVFSLHGGLAACTVSPRHTEMHRNLALDFAAECSRPFRVTLKTSPCLRCGLGLFSPALHRTFSIP